MITRTIDCTIERRLLVNFRIDPDVMLKLLPYPFRPHLVSGWALGGMCFIRLGGIRPAHVPLALGITTENVAHRFAVEWDDEDGTQVGVYVPKRYTNSWISSLAGGKIFPGQYGYSRFGVDERRSKTRITVASRDSAVRLSVAAVPAERLGGELFGSIDDAVALFRSGSLSYSPATGPGCFDGVRLQCESWDALPVWVETITSSYFDDEGLFPQGTCTLDSGLMMRHLPARFLSQGRLRSASPAGIRQM